MTERIVPRDDPVLVEHYSDLMAKLPANVVVIEINGTYRFKENRLVRWLVSQNMMTLNAMCVAFQQGAFSLEEYMEFYRGLGYSLSGFCEIFGDSLWPKQGRVT